MRQSQARIWPVQAWRRCAAGGLWGLAGVGCLALAGCVIPPLNTSDADFPAGTLMRLNDPVTIAANRAGGYLGNGSIETRYQYDATCRLEVRTLSDHSKTVAPDQFTVTGTAYDRDALSGPTYPGVLDGFNSFGDGPGLVYVNNYIYLHSEQQPDVLRLKCTQLRDNDSFGYLSAAQIKTVLGSAMTVVP